MNDEQYIQKLEDERDELVDINFVQAEDLRAERGSLRKLGRRKEVEEIHARRERMGLKSLKYIYG